MPIEVLLVQILVLVFTGALWWIARRDLAARVPPPAPPAASSSPPAELEQLCATLETLVTSLARRLDAVERAAETQQTASSLQAEVETEAEENAAVPAGPSEPVSRPLPAPDPHYAPVYALRDAGFDPIEIARQTGLGRGEVDLILSLRRRGAR